MGRVNLSLRLTQCSLSLLTPSTSISPLPTSPRRTSSCSLAVAPAPSRALTRRGHDSCESRRHFGRVALHALPRLRRPAAEAVAGVALDRRASEAAAVHDAADAAHEEDEDDGDGCGDLPTRESDGGRARGGARCAARGAVGWRRRRRTSVGRRRWTLQKSEIGVEPSSLNESMYSPHSGKSVLPHTSTIYPSGYLAEPACIAASGSADDAAVQMLMSFL